MEAAQDIALIGFGEAAMAFVESMAVAAPPRAYDRKTDRPDTGDAKRADYRAAGVCGCASNAEALAGVGLVLSLVTADQACAAARCAAETIAPGALYCDMNSVAPQTKRDAADLIDRAGGRYIDVAIMAPVRPARTAVPLLVSGPHADIAAAALRAIGFTDVTALDGPIGTASAIKMIRSVMVKGIEALSAECLLAAAAAGVSDAVIASLDASWPGADWARRGDYHLDRMMVHGTRRAAEMEDVVKTLDALGLSGAMARATVEWQRAIGALGVAPPDGLDAKTAAILRRSAAA